ncbi:MULTISPECIES: GTP cyclohydrolase FolE2 [unclassified Pseudomonas]|uniref:GTP cyclohydrolase FolE2 n=1 Tax=unclassified Pseudomonas TaxID=196821 RepID=UPI00235F3640|nr:MULTISPECIES: GTP cyclohydrolase FolE2 [unclassified Pseudomonas]MDR6178143.1 GTP cyclohydrolase I [Pseudomonas sp. SORGH_AS_0211]
MNAILPDVSLSETATLPAALDWVGMQGIDLPIRLGKDVLGGLLPASADVQVDLPTATAKGIHMSRLYQLLDRLAGEALLTPALLRLLLSDMVASHRSCDSRAARLRLDFPLLIRRPALVTPELSGWKRYPVRLDASWVAGVFQLSARIEILYASTCPCSAALSRQLIERAFLAEHGAATQLDPATVAHWLSGNASLATPHSQRSLARVRISLPADAADFGLLPLIDQCEQALGTPVQTAVKRADEQAFAALNGSNLMFVEDAARRLLVALRDSHQDVSIQVRHLESLHPHDASAWASSSPT